MNNRAWVGWILCFAMGIMNLVAGDKSNVAVWMSACIIISTVCTSRDKN